MATNVIDFYEKYRCMGGECPYTCCKRWGIALDDNTYSNYKKERGILALKLRLCTENNKEHGPVLRKIAGRCPFHTREKLCYFQVEERVDLMPQVCRVFPRRKINYGKDSELTLELGCFQAAGLFLEHRGRRAFVVGKEESDAVPAFWNIDHVDPVFYELMMECREKLLDYLWGDSVGLAEQIYSIYCFSYVANQWLAEDTLSKLRELHLPLTMEEQESGRLKKLSKDGNAYAFFPIPFLNRVLWGEELRKRAGKSNPVLDRIIKLYDNYYGKVEEGQADSIYQKRTMKMLKQQPELEDMLRGYFSYMLQQTFCLACEDYYLIKQVNFAILQLEFVMMCMQLEFMEEGSLDMEKQAELIVCGERTLRHSIPLKKRIMKQIRESFYR